MIRRGLGSGRPSSFGSRRSYPWGWYESPKGTHSGICMRNSLRCAWVWEGQEVSRGGWCWPPPLKTYLKNNAVNRGAWWGQDNLYPSFNVDDLLELCPMENLFIASRVGHENDDLFVEDLIWSGSVSSVILLVCSLCGWRCCCPIHGVTPNRDTFGAGGQRNCSPVRYNIEIVHTFVLLIPCECAAFFDSCNP